MQREPSVENLFGNDVIASNAHSQFSRQHPSLQGNYTFTINVDLNNVDLAEYEDELEDEAGLNEDEPMTESGDESDARKHDEVVARGESESSIQEPMRLMHCSRSSKRVSQTVCHESCRQRRATPSSKASQVRGRDNPAVSHRDKRPGASCRGNRAAAY